MSKQTCPGCGVEHDPMDWHDELLHNEDRCVLAALQTARSKLQASEKEVARLRALDQHRVDETNKALVALTRRAEAAESRLGAIRTWFEEGRAGLFSDQIDDLERLLGIRRCGYFCNRCKTQHITNEQPSRCLCGSPDIRQLYDSLVERRVPTCPRCHSELPLHEQHCTRV